MDNAKQVTIPAMLLGLAIVIFVSYGFYAAGSAGAAAVLLLVGVQLVIGVVLGIFACMVAAKILDISFGPLGTASLKLAAIFAFPAALALFIPYVGWLVVLVLYFALLAWLFDLEGKEVTICAVLIWVVRFVAFMLGAVLLASMS